MDISNEVGPVNAVVAIAAAWVFGALAMWDGLAVFPATDLYLFLEIVFVAILVVVAFVVAPARL
jgi:hypothetical protein